MAAPTVSVTVEDLDAALSDDTYDWCEVIGGFGFELRVVVWGRGGTVHPLIRGLPCPRRAAAVVVVTCSVHGTATFGVCARHLRRIRARPDTVLCHTCGTRVTMSGGGL